jgi:transcriptional regulator with XRE-family HTH domain
LSQSDLAKLTSIPQSTISAIENDRVSLGVERAKILARALKCHPAVLVFPGWDVRKESAAESTKCRDMRRKALRFSALRGLGLA